jgi:DNA-binding Lrp family transcriptional regulator
MSAAIVAAISHLPQLTNALYSTASRLAYFADRQGRVTEKSYEVLARDLHTTPRTMMRRIAQLEALHILRKHVQWLSPTRCAINVYTFLIGVEPPLHKCSSDRSSQTKAQQEREKETWREKMRREPGYLTRLSTMLATMVPGAPAYEGVQAEIALMHRR